MKPEEYEDFFRDPSNFWLRIYLPKIFGAFEGFRYLPPLTDIIEIPTGQLMALAQPQVLETLQKMIDAGRDLQKTVQPGPGTALAGQPTGSRR